MAVSNFQIELNEKGAYRAGTEISGHVILNVWSAIEISHIELLLHGRGTLRIFKDTSTFLEMPKHEVYLQQKILLMSPTSGAQTVILQPGRYESAFKYQLPDAVPPSVSQQELRHGCIFDITYMAQANMCRMRRSSVGNIKSTRRSFIILPDLSTSIAHQPISHTEYVKLFCLSMSSKPAKVTVHLNRGIFNPGENIKLKVVVTTAKSTCVQSVSADFEQVTTFNNDMIRKLRRTLVRTGEAHGHHLAAATVGATFVMPVPTNIVPSDLPHCHLLDITYIVKVIISFKQLAGSLSIRVPITVTPRSTHDHSSQGKSLFSQRMAHFHSFGKPALNTTISTESDNSSREDATTGRHLDEQVITTYKTPVPCCACCLSCMGVGICHFEEK